MTGGRFALLDAPETGPSGERREGLLRRCPSSTPARPSAGFRRTAPPAVSASRWAVISSSSRIGAAPSRRSATSSACASTRPSSSAFCSPVEQSRAGMRLGAVRDDEVGAVRTVERAAGGAVALARRRAAFARRRPRPRPPAGAARSSSSAPSSARTATTETANADRARAASAMMPRARRPPRARAAAIGDAGLGHDALEAREAGVIAHAVGEQAVAAAWRARSGRARAIAGIEAEDQPVEKAAALGGGAGEQAVHRRRHPDHLDIVGERAGAGLRVAVDAHDAAAALARAAPRPRARCRCRPGPTSVCARAATAQLAVAAARAPDRGTARGASPGRAPAARPPRADWSCPSRWRR